MAIKATHPVTHTTFLPGVSRYPVQERRADGDLTLTGPGWMLLSYIAYRKDRDAMSYLHRCFEHVLQKGFAPTEEWLRANEHPEVRGWHEMAEDLGDWHIVRAPSPPPPPPPYPPPGRA